VELSERPARKADQSVDAIAAGKSKHVFYLHLKLFPD
jgi:hypothetical protein